MYRTLPLLTATEVTECRKIAANTQFIDGRATNPHNKAKNNQQLHDPSASQASSHSPSLRRPTAPEPATSTP